MLSDAFPSFLIGLREGLEAGLVVSILLASLAKAGRRDRAGSVWLGVAAAAALSLSFAAVLTFTSAHLPPKAQDVFGGVMALLAVTFVTTMVFWMRRASASMSGDLKAKLAAALGASTGMLVFTAFAAVAREGLETALFLWTTAQTAHEKSGPGIGAVAGIAVAALLCWGLYHRALKLNLARFFKITGFVLVVIAAGVLAYGLTDLQESGAVGGFTSYAWDLTAHLDPNAWYSQVVAGTLNLTPKMTWLSVVGYVAYLAPVMFFYLRPAAAAVRPAPKTAEAVTPVQNPEVPEPAATPAASAPAPASRKPTPRWALGTAIVAVPAVVAGAVIVAVGPDSGSKGAQTIEVSSASCGKGFGDLTTGEHVFQMKNTGDVAAEVYLMDPSSSAVYGEIEGLAPGTTRPMTATIGTGTYAWRCVPNGKDAVTSESKRASGTGSSTTAVVPITEKDLEAPLDQYRAYVTSHLSELAGYTDTLKQDVDAGDLPKAEQDWLTAHLAYNRLGAAYGTFQDWDKKIDGRADGLTGKVQDPDFTGFHRLEYGLWHGEAAAALAPVADQLAADVHGLVGDWPKQDFDPADLPLRAHEILENTLQFQLTGDADYGSGSTLATADANLTGTREVLSVIRPLVQARDPRGLAGIDSWLDRFGTVVNAAKQPDGTWTPVAQLDPAARQKLNGTLGELLEQLSVVPDLLEIRKAT
ncbi:FTR1 family protein [Catenulispora sp. NL8]|uniref:FTR1 family protein n=1 Tax=Catenulispora pinistramenti TaxID=2705254 RepID=A0ABS5KWG3_9ACTN|nr:iron uptake transporter permease EfeU [Catenulispora pinistramenti]MBS2550421.1 FTR1 family protein [Catenulispora pinistramenti]